MKITKIFAAIAAVAATVPTTSHAQVAAQTPAADPFSVAEGMPPKLARAVARDRERLIAMGLIGDKDMTRGIASSLRVWVTAESGDINVCFYRSSTFLRQTIRDFALEWVTPGMYLPLNFGDKDSPRVCKDRGEKSQIRIAFNSQGEFRGRWSLVGSDAINTNTVLFNRDEPSMNLEGATLIDLGVDSQRNTLQRIVLHEFGHALGLEHEHQSPFAACEKHIDRDAMRAYFTKPPSNWQPNQIEDNMKVLHQPGMIAEGDKPDPNSIMFYALDASIFKEGRKSPCFRPIISTISPIDRQFVEALYPKDAGKQKALLAEREKQFAAALAKRGTTRGNILDQYLGVGNR